MYSSIHSLAMDGSVGVHGEFRGSMDGTHLTGDPCLVLSTDPKPRLRWTAELHDRFVDAVAQLGGPDSVLEIGGPINLSSLLFVNNCPSLNNSRKYMCALEASQSALGVSVSSESFRRSAVAELPRLMVLHLEPSFEAKTLHALAYEATPKTIMRTMGVKGLTLYHLKSHLQKYRLGKQSCKDLTENSKDVSCIAESQDTGSSTSTSSKLAQDLNEYANVLFLPFLSTYLEEDTKTLKSEANCRGYQVTEALRVQMEVQRRLHEQLEVQQRLQLRIEAQSKYLQSILEKACNALNDHAAATSGLEAARDKLSELAIKVSNDCNGLDPFDTPKIPSLSELATSLENRISSDLPARFGNCNGSPFSPTGEAAILKKRPRPLFGNGDLVPLEGRIGQVEWMMSNMG
ncbi:hypothetical protein RHSIM_Rhsim09G0055800 [Rhododendron simsii]|uniref:MYB-CC type transcription factor LHEQLE-containing domain-containing protein n=1 Tax=Rhododendron simsii TaxID=118357 RepID=A0A834GL04_RHOSS|nr:hypothetical protein RHSIM_Rhsim09G0055800 [Rhododendron simsii]